MSNDTFILKIDFKKGEGPASRIFAAAHSFTSACERFDRHLVESIDENMMTQLVIENIEPGSVRAILKNVLVHADDQALKDLDIKRIIGAYLVKEKHHFIKKIENKEVVLSLPDISGELQKIAAETDVRHLPDYRPLDQKTIIDSISDFQNVKDHLIEGDSITIISDEGEVDVNINRRIKVEEMEDLSVRETQVFHVPNMTLIVRKPDYLGSSKWDLHFGRRPVSAKIEDKAWLDKFQGRDVDVRPGDALRCKVRIENKYGYDNELISEHHVIEEVIDVLSNQLSQRDLFD